MCDGKAYLYTNLYLIYKPVFNYISLLTLMMGWCVCVCLDAPVGYLVLRIRSWFMFSSSRNFRPFWCICLGLMNYGAFSYFEDNSKTWRTLGIKMAFFELNFTWRHLGRDWPPCTTFQAEVNLIHYKIFKISLYSGLVV